MVSTIASSVNGESQNAWMRATRKISKGAQISDYKEKVSFSLCQIRINSLDDITKECFLDLGLFPAERKICADILLDIWVYVRQLKRHDAFAILLELARKNLLKITSNSRGNPNVPYGNASELYVSQRAALRDFAFNLGQKNNILQRKRLLIEKENNCLPGKCKSVNVRAFDSQILSIQTSPTEKNHYDDMNFSETEALLLFLTSAEYVLPTFLKSMKQLKFLMVSNGGTKKATLKGIDVLSSLTQLKSVRLERVISPFGEKQSMGALQNIEKLSLTLCEGFENISTFNTSKLKDFNLDHSSDLEELPLEICNMTSALSCSITNCHLLQKLPDDFGNVSHVRMLRLSALPFLTELPASIGRLAHLEYLDISACEGLKQVPKEIGRLKELKELDMRECSRLKKLPTTVCDLCSLKLVICDERIGKQWLQARNISIPELRVEIVEAHFNLDWLDD